ncbi:gamete-expressed 3 [Striga asiatica]|uniref:Gamete-expressed 3 n=1 Tax=Striga asiatica TaxID=4170 RepID=A0A5A7PE71_STRAF|nr:gamete-expressed 3 [Striga asiatica]
MGSGGEDLQKLKVKVKRAAAAAAHDYENDSRWADYWSNVLIPPHMASRNDVVNHFKHKFYQRYIDPELIVEPIGTSSTSQPARASTPPSQSSSSSTSNSNTRQRNSGLTSLHWDQQTIQFSVNAWVLVVAVFAIFPLVPTNLSNRAYRLSFFGTACSSLYSMYSLYGKPRAWNLPALQVWFQSVVVTKDFIYSIYCLSFVTSHLCLKFALIPILCRALEHVAKFLRRNFSRSTLYRKYLEEACVWVGLHTTTLSMLSSNAEIGIGFLLIISLFSWQRDIVQTFMYWQILKLMYNAPATAGYHQSTWAKIRRTVNPLIMCYAPFLKTLISALQRWFFRYVLMYALTLLNYRFHPAYKILYHYSVMFLIALYLKEFSFEFKCSAVDPYQKTGTYRLFKNFIGDDERVYACSGKDFFSFESNGTIAWKVYLNYSCNANIAPVHGGSSKIYVVAEQRVLKISTLRIGTSEAPVEVFFGPAQGKEGPNEITGLSASISSSCLLVNVKNRGLFALRLTGQLIWSAGPVLYQNGYRQGCSKNITECYFTSKPVIDHCEASIFISNTVGELYSLSVRGPYFKWIRDLSSYGGTFKVTTGNNGQLYVTISNKSPLVLALDVFMGNLLWQGSIGPLSSSDYEPVVDASGWVSYGSLDGFLYSFSPKGLLKKFPKSVSLNSVIQVEPILDCSGYGVYISQTEMEGKMSQAINEHDYVSALKPKSAEFTLLEPASGTIYRSENNPGKLLFNLSQSDLKHFVVDEPTLLAFFAASSVKLKSSCSQVKPESISIYTGNQRTIVMFLIIESVVLVILAAVVWYCCIFWKKKKLRGLELGKFLEKRRSLRFQKKAFDKMIKELEQKARASDERVSNLELFEKLSDLVKEREGVRRKLSTVYSLGRDKERSRSNSLLPLHDKKSRSFSFQGSKKESVTIFHTPSGESTSCEDDESSDFSGDGEFDERVKVKGKGLVEEESSSKGFVSLQHSFSEIEEMNKLDYKDEDDDDDDGVMVNMKVGSRSLRRRTVSFTN